MFFYLDLTNTKKNKMNNYALQVKKCQEKSIKKQVFIAYQLSC